MKCKRLYVFKIKKFYWNGVFRDYKNLWLIIEDIQLYEYCDVIINEIDETNFSSVEIVDLRNNKGRYDDLLIVVKK